MDATRSLSYHLPLGGPGFDLVETVSATIGRHRMLVGGEHVLVAVSGGPDSQCLLDVLRRLGQRFSLELSVAHFDHGTSEASAAAGARVARMAADAGMEVHYVTASGLAGPNFQARARDMRYRFFAEVAAKAGAELIATGHTLDDRVETTLGRLVHGAGTEGLAGIPPVDRGRIRPLISCRRAETRAYCDTRGIWFVADPSNDDERFERARIRKRVLPVLEEGWGDGGIRAAAVSAERLREDAIGLRDVAERAYRELARPSDTEVRFAADVFAALPRALQRRLLEEAVGHVRDRSGGIEAAMDAIESGRSSGARFSLPGGAEIRVQSDDVVVVRGGSVEDAS